MIATATAAAANWSRTTGLPTPAERSITVPRSWNGTNAIPVAPAAIVATLNGQGSSAARTESGAGWFKQRLGALARANGLRWDE